MNVNPSASASESLDRLTGVGDTRAAAAKLDELVASVSTKHSQVNILLIDIDRFGSINQRYGHAIGDQTLVELSQLLRELVPSASSTYRLRSDEFLVYLPDMLFQEARGEADRLRGAISSWKLKLNSDHEIRVTASVGLISFAVEQDLASNVLFLECSRALLAAKSAGGDCVASKIIS